MSHIAQQQFFAEVAQKQVAHYTKGKVLDVGSLDINGNNRGYFPGWTYLGLDLGPGLNVDVIGEIHLWENIPEIVRLQPFDVIVSSEMLEHDRHWKASLWAMYDLLRSGGLFMLTCAAPGRGEHGTKANSPADAPFTNDWYRNISAEDFFSVLSPGLFDICEIRLPEFDLQFWGIKK